MSHQTSRANAIRPKLPLAAPAASRLAAPRARLVPSSPARCFFCFTCFSINVVVGERIAGKARNSPPIPGPNLLAIMPVTAVINPPNRKRTAYSCHVICPSAERLKWTFIERLLQDREPEHSSYSQPYENQNRGRDESRQFIPHHHPAYAGSVNQERHRASRHRTSFCCSIGSAFRGDGEPKGGQRNRWSGAEEAGEALGFEQVAQNRESGNHNAADQEAEQSFFQQTGLPPYQTISTTVVSRQ